MNDSLKKFKRVVWPIEPHETSRIILLSSLLFFVCFVYSVLRPLKDTVVVTASSAEVIPFIKVWSLLPMALLFTSVYAKLSSKYSRERVFYCIVGAFIAFFLLFAFAINPNAEAMHLDSTAIFLRKILPQGFNGLIAMIEYWSYTLFYCLAELWSNIVLGILTYGFINQITSIKQAPRFYAVLGVASNSAAIAAGLSSNFLMSLCANKPWQTNLQWIVSMIAVCGFIILLLFKAVNKDLEKKDFEGTLKSKKAKVKFNLQESFKEIIRSRHLMSLAVIVVSYFFVINTVEVVWKEQLRHIHSSPKDFNTYMNFLTAAIGFFSTITAIFMANIIKRLGWSRTALITPFLMLVTSLLFFGFIVKGQSLAGIVSMIGTSPIVVAVFLGGLQNCLSKSAKYSLFDATKEIAFIPLPKEAQLKGKAAIDGVGSRLGKCGASLSHQILLIAFGSMASSIPIMGVLMIAVISVWIFATRSLGRRLDYILEQEKDEEANVQSGIKVDQCVQA